MSSHKGCQQLGAISLAVVLVLRQGNTFGTQPTGHQTHVVQEEQKVAILRGKLEDMGVDVDKLLEAVGDAENDPPDA